MGTAQQQNQQTIPCSTTARRNRSFQCQQSMTARAETISPLSQNIYLDGRNSKLHKLYDGCTSESKHVLRTASPRLTNPTTAHHAHENFSSCPLGCLRRRQACCWCAMRQLLLGRRGIVFLAIPPQLSCLRPPGTSRNQHGRRTVVVVEI